MKLLLVILAWAYSCMLVVDAFEVLSDSGEHIPQQQLPDAPNTDSEPLSDHAYVAFMRYLLRNSKQNVEAVPGKRFSTSYNGLPYFKSNKRNDGVWIWMPAQGYVSVPRQQQLENGKGSKSGKIMRYGK